jgi:diacylglycerol diphosphate phosphatase / phosphatidate phosphatase
MAFASMMFVSLYLMGKMRVMSSARQRAPLFAEAIIPLFPLILAFFIAVSRVVDYRHHFADILAGAVIGSTVAVYLYHMNFEPLMTSRSQFPRFRCFGRETCDGSLGIADYSPAGEGMDGV